MVKLLRVCNHFLIILILLSLTGGRKAPAYAQEEPRERQTTIVVSTTEYEWWLVRWAGNHVICQIFLDHEGLPGGEEIFDQCGSEIFEEWEGTEPCKEVDEKRRDLGECEGVYLLFIGTQSGEREVVVDLPPPLHSGER